LNIVDLLKKVERRSPIIIGQIFFKEFTLPVVFDK
jgi:hypothetical protein